MGLPLEAKTALVTGASKGVGKGIALELARCGCDIAINYNSDRDGAEPPAAAVDAMFAAVLEKFPRLDILVNNAGTQVWKPLLELEESEWDRVIDTNLKGCFLCTQRAARHMRTAGGGRIVN